MTLDLIPREVARYDASTFPPPREFQDRAHEQLREGARAGHRCQVLMAPTGAGKTYLGMRAIHEALLKYRSAIFLCDRTTLINQTSAVADKYGLASHGIVQANHWRVDHMNRFQIASTQTLARRGWPKADLIIVDECHTQYKTWTDHIQETDAHVIGLSATPFSTGLGRLFTNLVNAATMDELTKAGVLVPMVVYTGKRIDMTGAETKAGGEWADSAAAQRGMEIIGDVVTEWSKYAAGRKTIVFGATIAHCEEMARQFNEVGIRAACFTADTTAEERAELLAAFVPGGHLQVLISVEALAKGFDATWVGCVCDCRPLRKSLSTAIQMWGRGLRCSPETGKTDCILLDFSGNIQRFADDYSDIFYNGLSALDSGEKLDKVIRKDDEEDKEGKSCPSCGYRPCGKRCISCGFERVSQSLVSAVAGEMAEFKVGKATIGDKMDVWAQSVTLCRSQGNPDTAPGRAFHLYRSITGVAPHGLPRFDETPNVTVSRAVLNKHRANMIAYRAAKAAA